MADLFPVFDVPSEIADVTEEAESGKYYPGPLWDFETGDFIMDGAHRSIYGSGYDAWVLWCTKTIMTQRWAHLAYSSAYGVESEEAFAESDREAVEASFELSITEALLADPYGRTTAVRDFEFSWVGDELSISCVAVGTDGNTADIEANVKV